VTRFWKTREHFHCLICALFLSLSRITSGTQSAPPCCQRACQRLEPANELNRSKGPCSPACPGQLLETEFLNPNRRLDTMSGPFLPTTDVIIYHYGDRKAICVRRHTYDVRLSCHNLPASSFCSQIVARGMHRSRSLQYIRKYYSRDCTPREHRFL
jgi:hypothetical protein